MKNPFLKWAIVATIVIVILGIGFFVFWKNSEKVETVTPVPIKTEVISPIHTVIGQSVEKRKIDAYTYGTGKTHLVFVGGIHGGYEWNSVLLAYKFMDYLDANPLTIPASLTVTVIPSLNPDGLYKVVKKEGRFTVSDVPVDKVVLASGRFNGNNVDLNRNFDCKWQPKSTWQSKVVDAGTEAFSEPEAKAIRDFVLKDKSAVVVFWHSQSGAVYASRCKDGILPETLTAINIYGKASGYKVATTFDAYPTTGGADDWLASVNVPAFTVELTTHQTIEWEKNLAGVKALFEYYK